MIDNGGKSHHLQDMPIAAKAHTKGITSPRSGISVVEQYDTAADSKKRISLRGAQSKYFHVKALSNGSYLLEPRVLLPRDAVPARTLKMLEHSVANLKKGKVSAPIDLTAFTEK
jgi:hypothetical protein